MRKLPIAIAAALTAFLFSCRAADRAPEIGPDGLQIVQANDNREAAGTLRDGVLTVRLAVRMARWYPEEDGGPSVLAPVFVEEGRAPQIPGPLIRVPAGTIIDATVRNELSDSTITMHGFDTRPASVSDSVFIAPGQTHSFRFPAGEPGTYFYFARAGLVDHDEREREQLAGALIIDPASGAGPDRIFVVNIWGEPVDSVDYRNALAINGRAFPHNEALTATVGQPERWRVINASMRNHPMHLHGFFFRVDSRGDARSDTTYSEAQQRLAVTEDMRGLQTMLITWTPERDGNWLFHCHLAFHVVPEAARLDAEDTDHDAMSGNVGRHMAGLVLAISVNAPADWTPPPHENPRRLRLFVNEVIGQDSLDRAMAYVLQGGDTPPAPDSLVLPGSPLILTRDEPTDVVVVNRMSEATGVHWHGLELESWSDGVVGWSGSGNQVAQPIAPGDSFTARLTLRRAGTFIYHTHLNDLTQLTSGLYGPIIVLEPGQPFDPATDHTFIVGWDGIPDDLPNIIVNGDSASSAPLEIEPDIPHRVRLINMGPAAAFRFSILQDSTPVQWRALAKDGADLPDHQAVAGPAEDVINIGETADFEFTPAPGEYVFAVDVPNAPVRLYTRKIVVTARQGR